MELKVTRARRKGDDPKKIFELTTYGTVDFATLDLEVLMRTKRTRACMNFPMTQSLFIVDVAGRFWRNWLLTVTWRFIQESIGFVRSVIESWRLSEHLKVKIDLNKSFQILILPILVHMTTHSGNKPYKCKHASCSESFINKVVLERHMRFHGLATKVYRCEYCFKQLSTETSLKSHVQRLHKTTVQCELCKTEFTTREHLKDHLSAAHEPSVCQVCHKSFTLPRYLKMHEKLHYEDSTARVQCLVCSKLLGMKNIKSHVYRTHFDHFEAWQLMNPTL